MRTYEITTAEAVNVIIKNTRGTIFRVIWRKKNGEIRSMLARTGAWRQTKGGKDTTAHIPGYMNLWDVTKRAFRKVNVNTIKLLRACGCEYVVEYPPWE